MSRFHPATSLLIVPAVVQPKKRPTCEAAPQYAVRDEHAGHVILIKWKPTTEKDRWIYGGDRMEMSVVGQHRKAVTLCKTVPDDWRVHESLSVVSARCQYCCQARFRIECSECLRAVRRPIAEDPRQSQA